MPKQAAILENAALRLEFEPEAAGCGRSSTWQTVHNE
jgi:hypothetical protein